MTVVAFRHSAYDTPWWANPNSQDGRFNCANGVPTQYLCLHPLGPAAEMLRHNLGPVSMADADTLLLNLWAVQVELDGLVRLDFDTCTAYGLSAEDLVGDDCGPTQEVAGTVSAAGAPGIVFHSASLPGTHNVAIFGPRVLHPYSWQPSIAEEVPTGHLSDGARSPAEVLPFVRWFGTDHPALLEWTATGTYAPFDDPVPTRW